MGDVRNVGCGRLSQASARGAKLSGPGAPPLGVPRVATRCVFQREAEPRGSSVAARALPPERRYIARLGPIVHSLPLPKHDECARPCLVRMEPRRPQLHSNARSSRGGSNRYQRPVQRHHEVRTATRTNLKPLTLQPRHIEVSLDRRMHLARARTSSQRFRQLARYRCSALPRRLQQTLVLRR